MENCQSISCSFVCCQMFTFGSLEGRATVVQAEHPRCSGHIILCAIASELAHHDHLGIPCDRLSNIVNFTDVCLLLNEDLEGFSRVGSYLCKGAFPLLGCTGAALGTCLFWDQCPWSSSFWTFYSLELVFCMADSAKLGPLYNPLRMGANCPCLEDLKPSSCRVHCEHCVWVTLNGRSTWSDIACGFLRPVEHASAAQRLGQGHGWLRGAIAQSFGSFSARFWRPF